MDDDMQAMDARDREIERRLEAYARARLSPDPQSVARARARVLREARLQIDASRIAAYITPSIALAPRRSMTRRMAMPLLAASVWLGIAVGSISAAQPGGPLYATRMWVENATLPSDSAARAGAELTRLENRLAEAYAASARGDSNAVQAALDAYGAIADEAIATTSGNEALEALVAAALDKHRAVLAAVAVSLEGKGNDTAVAAVEASIQRAIDHNQVVIDRLEAAGAGGGGNGATGGSGSNAGGVDGVAPGTGTGSGGGAGSGTDGRPDRTPKPTAEPKSTPVPQGPPDHSPRGQDR